MKTADVRTSFLKFFEGRGHRVVPSDSLIPSTDPSLLFTSAGMVQFKPNFSNPAASPFPRATSCQKCLRTSDIERVGQTLRHLTFFEMLGNFSFGDYFKQDAIVWGWEFLTRTMGLPGDRFVVSVHHTDSEAFDLWKAIIPANKIVKLGDETNFWTMGPTGPCGPCSEILWDRGASWSCGKPTCGPDCDCDRYLEVWNLVFTQFDRKSDGKLEPLPKKNIDTGMGLERLSLLLQGAASPFGTDGFQAIFQSLARLSSKEIPVEKNEPHKPDPENVAFRRIADHCRAITFMIADGILPSNEGRGYVLRRLLRQAVSAGKVLDLREPFLYQMTGTVIDVAKIAYPEILQRRETIASVVKIEEEKFLETLESGTRLVQQLVQTALAKKVSTLPGKELFQLYDTYGFPFELSKEMAEGFGLKVDAEGFEASRRQAVELARQGWKGSGAKDMDHYHSWKAKLSARHSQFRGYEGLEASTQIISPMWAKQGEGWKEVAHLEAGGHGEIVLKETPFYPEGGGQVGDQGILEGKNFRADVLDTQAPVDGLTVHSVRVTKGVLSGGDSVRAQVDRSRRESTMRHHTATHMLHKALQEVLGPQVTQAGSLVAPERLRFDFNHNASLTPEQRHRVEEIVNEKILGDLYVRPCPMAKEEAQKKGAMMLFGEKYGSEVRAVSISPHDDCDHWQEAWSMELCGGTHVHTTGQIGLFKIVSQSAVSANVRRIEAVAGKMALQAVRRMEHQLHTLAETLKTAPEDLIARIDRLLTQERQLEKEIEHLKSGAVRDQFDEIVKSARSVGGIPFVSRRLEGVDEKQLRDIADRLKNSAKLGLVMLVAVNDGKASFVVSASKEVVARGLHAGQVAKEFAALIDGSAGGRPDFAQGGGKNIEALPRALSDFEQIIKKMSIKTSHTPER